MRRVELGLSSENLNPGQLKLLRSTSPVTLMAGGYGSGKTLALGLKLLQLRTINRGVPGMLVAPTWRTLFSATKRRLDEFLRLSLPRGMMPVLRDRTGECYLDFGDGVPVFLRSASNPGSLDGINVGWALGDELRYWPKESYEVLLGRVRINCPLSQAAFASTPAMNFMADEFNAGKEGRELITAPTRENARNLSPNYISNLQQSYSPRLQRAVIDGIFTILEGAVFEAFDPNVRTSPWIVDYDGAAERNQHKKTYLAVDPGYRKSAWIWVQEAANRKWVVTNQLMLDNTSDSEAIRQVNTEIAKGHQVDEVWVDPAARAKQSALGLDTITMMRHIKARKAHGRRCIRYLAGPFRDKAYGIDKVRTLLGDPYNPHTRMSVGFSRQLAEKEQGTSRGIIRDLGSLRYKDSAGRAAEDDMVEKDGTTDHSTDAFRYWAVGMWVTNQQLRDMEHDQRLKDYLGSRPGFRQVA